jgi:hypothetical protein
MNPDKNTRLFIIVLAAGLLLVGTTVFLQGQSIMKIQKSLSTIADSIDKQDVKLAPTPEVKTSTSTPTPSDRKLLTLPDANSRLISLIAQVDADWNEKIDLEKMTTEPMTLGNGRKVHVPFDPSWGNSRYELDTFEFSDGTYHFGPMMLSEMHGALRYGMLRETKARSLEAALQDKEYTSQDCTLSETFTPAKVRVGNVDTVRFEGSSCEGGWIGYEIQFGDRNLIISDSFKAGDELSRWVLERM